MLGMELNECNFYRANCNSRGQIPEQVELADVRSGPFLTDLILLNNLHPGTWFALIIDAEAKRRKSRVYMSMKARTVLSGKIAIIEIKGSLIGDGDTDQLRALVNDFIEQGNKCLVINLQKVNYLNSSGIGAIIASHASYKRNGGEVRLAGVTNNVQNLLVVTKLIDVFEVFDTVNQAVESFSNAKSMS
jgi:anti-sigma B factor antagonist